MTIYPVGRPFVLFVTLILAIGLLTSVAVADPHIYIEPIQTPAGGIVFLHIRDFVPGGYHVSINFDDTEIEFFSPGDVDELADCIRHLYSDTARLSELVENTSEFNRPIKKGRWTKSTLRDPRQWVSQSSTRSTSPIRALPLP